MAHPRQLEWQKFFCFNFVRRLCCISDNQCGPIGVFCVAVGQLDRSAEALLQSCFAVKPAGGVNCVEALGQAKKQGANRKRQSDNACPKQGDLRNRGEFVNDQCHQPQANAEQQSTPHAAPTMLNFPTDCRGLYFAVDDLFFAHAKAQCCARYPLFARVK